MVFTLLRCVGRALVNHGLKAIARWLPLGEVLYDIADEALEAWRRDRREDERRAEVQALAQAAAEDVRAQVARVVEEVAADQPPEVRDAVGAYLVQLPATVRQSLRRPADPSGTT